MNVWRVKLIPACPGCKCGAEPALHRDCPEEWRREPELYINIGNGHVRCSACGKDWPVENTTHFCTDCGAVYEGGEIWRGMAAEIGQAGNRAWLRAAGIRRGTPEITFLGWWYCRWCRRTFDRDTGDFLKTGEFAYGGLCDACIADGFPVGAAQRVRRIPEEGITVVIATARPARREQRAPPPPPPPRRAPRLEKWLWLGAGVMIIAAIIVARQGG